MKLTKAEIAAIVLTLVFVAVASGYYFGRGGAADFSISTERRADEAALLTGGDELEELEAPENTPDAAERIDINSADKEELSALPGIGEVLAGRIIEYREQNGAFEHIEDIMDVYGIGEAKFNGVSDYIRVG